MARYQEAIDWIALNDDTQWATDADRWDDPILSVTASLVVDLFGKPEATVVRDIRRAIERYDQTREEA